MKIKDEVTYNEVDARMEELLAKGAELGGMENLCEEDKEEFKILSNAAYEWECEVDPHPWRVKPSLIAAIKVAFRKKGLRQKEAAKIIGVSRCLSQQPVEGGGGLQRRVGFEAGLSIRPCEGFCGCGRLLYPL